MQCPQCQYENAPDAKFCNECGTPQALHCCACGTEKGVAGAIKSRSFKIALNINKLWFYAQR